MSVEHVPVNVGLLVAVLGCLLLEALVVWAVWEVVA